MVIEISISIVGDKFDSSRDLIHDRGWGSSKGEHAPWQLALRLDLNFDNHLASRANRSGGWFIKDAAFQ